MVLNRRFAVTILFLALVLGGCKRKQPEFVFMPDLFYSPAVKAQEKGSMRVPVEGTVPRGYEPYRWNQPGPEMQAKAARENLNPLPRTASVLARGQHIFNTYCIVCHGAQGMGDGSVVPPYPKPPSLHSDKVRGWKDGDIYHVITMGQNIMPSYARQIMPDDRWAVIHYVRTLQRAQNPTPSDLEAAKHAAGQ